MDIPISKKDETVNLPPFLDNLIPTSVKTTYNRFLDTMTNLQTILRLSLEPWKTAIYYYYTILRIGNRRWKCNKNSTPIGITNNFFKKYSNQLPQIQWTSFESFAEWMRQLNTRMPQDTPEDVARRIKITCLDCGISKVEIALDTLTDYISDNRSTLSLQSPQFRVYIQQLLSETQLMSNITSLIFFFLYRLKQNE